MRLATCPHCTRHVRLDASTCPFCDAALSSVGPRLSKVGAVIAGAATLSALTGCPRPAPKYGAPPAPLEQPDTAQPAQHDGPAAAGDDEAGPDSGAAPPASEPDSDPAVDPERP